MFVVFSQVAVWDELQKSLTANDKANRYELLLHLP